jgi:hypothetical protein
MVGVHTQLGEQLFDVALRQGKAQDHPTANRITSGSNCRHLNKPQTEDARRSIQLPYHRMTAKLQHFLQLCLADIQFLAKLFGTDGTSLLLLDSRDENAKLFGLGAIRESI